MQDQHDFLVEIHTEELPPKSLNRLAKSFLDEMTTRLQKAELAYDSASYFATPRRLAVLIKKLAAKQADTVVERKGPALEAAFNQEGQPTPACVGFARSCGVTPDQLMKIESKAGTWMGFKQAVAGKTVQELLPELTQQSLLALPIPKRMRWGSYAVEFVRPVQRVAMLYGDDVIDADILGCRADRVTSGHRFMSTGLLQIKNPESYAATLEKGYVIADFERRKGIIREQAKKINSHVDIDDALLDEVTALVEWPVALSGQFDEDFLRVPQEALISAMQEHQRYFPVLDKNGKLQAQFVMISNIESHDPARVVAGNERVLRARLSDAAFFFDTDQKQTLESRLEHLKNMIFQAKLGTLYDKSKRVAAISKWLAGKLNVNVSHAERAAWLAKTDLTSHLVGEFPELQGIAGCYYAKHDGEPEEVAVAIKEHYLPRFSGDTLPQSPVGCVVAIADRIDTIFGIFQAGLIPTGDKDPYGLRRAALGILRILVENKINLDLQELLEQAKDAFKAHIPQPTDTKDLEFMLERLKSLYQEQSILSDVFSAVAALNITKPYDLHCRIQAVQDFKNSQDAEALAGANKRVSNILAKYDEKISAEKIDPALFEVDAERILVEKMQEKQQTVMTLSHSANYQEALAELAKLRQPVDDFFDQVLVMTDDKPRRENRLLMLKQLRELFLHVADIALLQ